MKLQLIGLIFGALWTGQSLAQQLTLKADAPVQYQVKTGDTLWDIAGLYLAKPWLWPELWQANPAVKNPDLIYPGDILMLRFDPDGKPVLQKNESEHPLTFVVQQGSAGNDAVIKLRPRIRKQQSATALGLLPSSVIQSFLAGHQLKAEAELQKAAYVLGATMAIKNAVSGHVLYVHGELSAEVQYGVYRQIGPVTDPHTGNELGTELTPLARLKILPAVEGQSSEIHRAELTDSRQEVRQGDWVLPLRQATALPARFTQVADLAATGQILSSASGLREFASWEVVLINLGTVHGVQPGQILPVYRRSPQVLGERPPRYSEDSDAWGRLAGALYRKVEMPFEAVGQILVLEPQAYASFVMVVDAQQPLRLGDRIGGQDAVGKNSQTAGGSGAERP
ncbi:LysM domain-containing protein [Rheinheimera sp.]|uniref:LysM peptidoglycan-binding domain-containing protein n=1 Tax=Rheinheimera sp. TaxID=1869214 RepID=UPI00307F21F1